MKITLMKHQEEIHNESKDKTAAAFFMETGTGKTITLIETMKHLKEMDKINFAVIAAPKMVVDLVWVNELYKYVHSMPHRIFRWVGNITPTEKYIIREVVLRIKQGKENKVILPILLVNIEAFSHSKIVEFMELILRGTESLFCIDESTNIKNMRAIRTKTLLKLRHLPKYKRILSGFPVLKSPEDLYTQVKFLGDLLPYASFYAYRNDFSVLRHMGKYVVTIQHKNLDKLSRLIQPFSYRVLKKDCLDLPDKVRTKRSFEMTKEQNEMYQSMKTQGFLELSKEKDQKVFAVSLLTQIGKLQQIASGIIIQTNTLITDAKFLALRDLIDNEIPDQCTIWSCFTECLFQIQKVFQESFGENCCGIIHGGVAHDTRVRIIEQFQKGRIKYLIANPATIMHGLNLTNCSYAIYFNNSTNLEHRIQSEDRFHRYGQKNKVTYIDLLAIGTVEEKILDRLQEHHKTGADILQDDWQDWFK